MSEYLPFFEYIDLLPVKIDSIDDLRHVVAQLEEYHLFDTAAKIQEWEAAFKQYIIEEFDDDCLTAPIPQLEADSFTYQAYNGWGAEECDLEEGWLHEYELGELGTQYFEIDDGGL
jgi:hypothetical protein